MYYIIFTLLSARGLRRINFFKIPPCNVVQSYDILRITFTEHGVVAQLVSALDCRSGGCGFEPRRPRQYGKHAGLPRGVMVAPQILILLVGVRVPARQPFFSS